MLHLRRKPLEGAGSFGRAVRHPSVAERSHRTETRPKEPTPNDPFFPRNEKEFMLYTSAGRVGSTFVSGGPLVEAVKEWDIRRRASSAAMGAGQRVGQRWGGGSSVWRFWRFFFGFFRSNAGLKVEGFQIVPEVEREKPEPDQVEPDGGSSYQWGFSLVGVGWTERTDRRATQE